MIVVPKRKMIVLKLRDPARVTTVIPKAKVILYRGERLVVVHHGADEVKVLRNLGINPPSPILHYYDWPGQFTPFDAQRVTADFLTSHKRAFCLNEIGTGKSLAALWAFDYLHREKLVRKMLVVCPLSTMARTWGDEIFKGFPHLDVAILYGSRERRLKLLKQDVDIYIINHDGVEIIQEALASRPDIDLIIIDEVSQVARNAGTDRWRALNVVINKQVPRATWGLTGTPIPNAPTDAWAQCKLLVPEKAPRYFNRFKDQVMRQVGPYKWIPRDTALDTVYEALRPSIRFSRDDCIDLPECLFETRHVELSPEQEYAYKQMLNTMHMELDNGQVTAVNEAVKISKLLQIVCGVAYSNDGEEISIPSAGRLRAVLELVEEAAGKVIIFVPFVSAVNKVVNYLTSKHVSVECIHGGVSKAERDRIFKAFQSRPEPRVIVAQPAAMSHGLTLTSANTIVWFAPHFSNEVFTQANGRITRPGQRLNQFIVMLEGSPMERKLYDRLRNKQKMQGILLDLVQKEAYV